MRKNTPNTATQEAAFTAFCRERHEGEILYNLDSTNLWGEYLLIVSKIKFKVNGTTTYCLILHSVTLKDHTLIPLNRRIDFSSEMANSVPFLKPVGFCKFELNPHFTKVDINLPLIVTYKNQDIWDYTKRSKTPKPKKRTYGIDGLKIIKPTDNLHN